MSFTKYLLATAASQMLRELPQMAFIRNLRNRARRARIVRMKSLRRWHLRELARLRPNAHPGVRVWHEAEIKQVERMYRLYVAEVERDQEHASAEVLV